MNDDLHHLTEFDMPDDACCYECVATTGPCENCGKPDSPHDHYARTYLCDPCLQAEYDEVEQ